MTDYHREIEELIDKKLKLALAAIEQERQQTLAAFAREREGVKTEADALTRDAYADHAKAVDPTGIESEALAAKGLADSGKKDTAKSNQDNVYARALASLRAKTEAAMGQLSEKESKALSALAEQDTKAKDNAYTLLMKEQERSDQERTKQAEAASKQAEAVSKQAEAELKKAEAERQKAEAELKKAEAERQKAEEQRRKAEAERQKTQASKKTTTTQKTATEASSYPTNGTDRQKYNWLKGKLEELVAGAKAGEKLVEVARPYLETAHKDLNDQYYLKLLDIVV